MSTQPTREPIETPCRRCKQPHDPRMTCDDGDSPKARSERDTPYIPRELRSHAPQPTAQAGEACKWCFGTGVNADGNPKNPQPETPCAACHGTGKVPAPPTPSAGHHDCAYDFWCGACNKGFTSKYELHGHACPASPQLPTPGIRPLLQKYFNKYNPYDGEAEQTIEAIEAVYNQRFEAALPLLVDYDLRISASEAAQEVVDKARQRWYEGGTNHGK